MMGLKHILTKVAPHLNQVIAEEAFKLGAVSLTHGLEPGDLRHMAENNVVISQMLAMVGAEPPQVDNPDDPRVQYLQSCSDERLLELLADVLPEHSAVLNEFPAYALLMCADLKKLIGGSNAGDGD